MNELAGAGLLLLLVVAAGWQARRLWGYEALTAYIIGAGIGCLLGIVIGRS